VVPDDQRFGILPKGRILRSPGRWAAPATGGIHRAPSPQAGASSSEDSFYLQLIEPEPGILDVEDDECWSRIGLGAPDVAAAVRALRARGVEFVEAAGVHTDMRGALTQTQLGSVTFELVHDDRPSP